MVTYRVDPGYDCRIEDFKLILEKLADLRKDPTVFRTLPVFITRQGLHEAYREVVEGWLSGEDKLAIVVSLDEPCIRLNCSGSGVERMAKELHRKAIIAELWRFSMGMQINLDITSA